jgi:hypothetical protein
MKNKALYIGIGVAALLGYFFLIRKKTDTAVASSDDMENKSAETSESTQPTKGMPLPNMRPPVATTCGCGTGQIPCPNVRCATKTNVTSTSPSSSQDDLFKRFGITQSDYDKMMGKRLKIRESLQAIESIPERKKQYRRRLREFAAQNNISYGAFKTAFEAMNTANSSSISPMADSETETFAFTLTF